MTLTNLKHGSQIDKCGSSVIRLILCLFLTISIGFTAETATSQEQTESRFARTLSALSTGDDASRVAFANIAITQLIEIYIAEADLARNEAHESRNVKLQGWAAAVEQFNDDLFLVLEDLEVGFPVAFSVRLDGPVVLLVGGRTVLLTHPRADQQVSYEQRVLVEFCRRKNCDELTAVRAPPEPIPVSVIAKNPVWSFTDNGPVCISIDGDIRVQFPSIRNLPLFRDQCRQFLHEVTALELDIRRQTRHGVIIEGDRIEIEQQALGIEHRVTLNTTGDSVLITLPLLYGSPLVLNQLGLWMSDRIANGAKQVLRIDAVDITWESNQ